MKAYFIHAREADIRLELRDVPVPKPGPGQLLVRVRAASLNRKEFLRSQSVSGLGEPKPAGSDGAGEVEGTGERVMGRLPEAFAEYALMDKHDAVPVPPNLSWEQAAAVPIVFMVVHDMLVTQGDLKAGEWLLVAGVTSGTGVAALQVAKVLGAKVIGTSRSKEKLDHLKALGLDLPVQTQTGGFYDRVMQATGGKGADLIVNTIGGTVFAECIRSLGFQGRFATVGYVDGVTKSEIDLDALQFKRLKLFGVANKLRTGERRAVTVQGFIRDFLPLFASGKLRPVIDRVYDFKDLPAARAYMESDAHVGKIVVRL